ncbi:3-methyl-2-oxobutanoate hydroxymethyltransferase [Paenibacillus thermoaerophilus]|uniref:3-methyl-2-oxobutanoate hydroxymethyltransferase n=1 Tax=Paenibacillus thermoaerophilus TaxID=1215385 RepID=A0ABW2V2X5_9BACL|nr:3-methyl-2-oxobutanoate hydroxymethyltransferase [Paenibacillus thermoaerophilus]TMV18675.1 3-methyl-2-oxobutanoate hydroxymethyltransferase [Paenibacillus thermoaerophilus]
MGFKPVTTATLRKMKSDGTPITMVTAYDYPSAKLADEAGVDMILVGDSLGNVVLGYDSTLPVTLEDMIYHTRAVCRGAQRPFIVTDMPFMTYHGSLDLTLASVARLMREGGCKAVKLEGGREIADTVRAIVTAGVPVVGHIGLTPQSVHQIGGYRVQGKTANQAERLLEDALALEQAGAFAIVLELVTEDVARLVTSRLSIPTIGIGAGPGCDGQVLVFHDLLQYASPSVPKKMVKTYADIGSAIRNAISSYVDDVRERRFPGPEHSFRTEQREPAVLYGSGSSSASAEGKGERQP